MADRHLPKLAAALLLALALAFELPAADNELFRTDSWEWRTAHALCVANGAIPPSSVSPCPAGQIVQALMAIPSSRLDADETAMRDAVISRLGRPMPLDDGNVGLDPSISLNPEIYAQTTPLEKQWDHLYGIKDMMSDVVVGLKVRLGEVGWAFGDWIFISQALMEQYPRRFDHNMRASNQFQAEAIFNGGLALGNGFIQGGALRARQSMGYGRTGNLMVADNFSHQDFVRLSIRSKWFDYTLNLTHFDHSGPMGETAAGLTFSNQKFNGIHQIQAVHRFEFKLFDRLQAVFMEGVMLASQSPFDLRLLNPFIFFHGLENHSQSMTYDPNSPSLSDEANNYVVAELGLAATPHLRFNLQFLMDQIQQKGEEKNPNVFPQAYGILMNIETAWVAGRHHIGVWAEGAYLMPATYLDRKRMPDELYFTNLDMITGYRNKAQQEVGYAGYVWGPDSITAAAGLDWGVPGVCDLAFSITYLVHGQYGWGYRKMMPDIGPEHFSDMALAGIGWENAEHRLIARIDGSAAPASWIAVEAGIGFVSAANLGTVKGRSLNDLQMRFGLSISPFEPLKRRSPRRPASP